MKSLSTTTPESSDASAGLKKKLRTRRSYVIFGLVVLGAALWPLVLQGDLMLMARMLIEVVRQAGPWVFFSAMAFLPVFGFPLAPFNLAAGPTFSDSMGMPLLILLASTATAVNVALSYGMARYLLRPPITRLLLWLGYTIPSVPKDRHLAVAFLVRITPGPPFFLQSYLLGLADIHFLPYMIASWSIASMWSALAILGGDALIHGNLRLGLFALGLIGALMLGLKLLRKKIQDPKGKG